MQLVLQMLFGNKVNKTIINRNHVFFGSADPELTTFQTLDSRYTLHILIFSFWI